MEKKTDIDLWINDLISNEFELNFIKENLRNCHRLRNSEGLKKLSNAEMINYVLKLYNSKKENRIKKKSAKINKAVRK